ncbi:YraN family protein [Halothiobacillus diazotrophicus]|uniref:UPF0102 protein A9404_03220 n=1 Tax=Halothiobacillus diazotrophicus TaxID=1860122 RepID=A0A191ZK57_9GAMM|nr:YraN family protein [Halothiobacillus diazotrophicus]
MRHDDPGKPSTLTRGHEAESRAADHLVQQGLTLVARNIRAGRGEIDLLMEDGPTLVFVEVRARRARALVSPLDSISQNKRSKIIETATRLLQSRGDWQNRPCRFDVVAVHIDPERRTDRIDWIRDAFHGE